MRMGNPPHVIHPGWMGDCLFKTSFGLQGYLAHTKTFPPRTLQQDYAQGPMVVLWGGGLFDTSETPLSTTRGKEWDYHKTRCFIKLPRDLPFHASRGKVTRVTDISA